MVAYPLPTFPGRTQENLLGQLLRKKLEPNVEDWVERGREIATDATKLDAESVKEHELLSLWEWAGMAANEQARKHTWGGDFTLEERDIGIENVDTGLRRKFEESGDDSSDDDEAMEKSTSSDLDMEIGDVQRRSGAAGSKYEVAKETEDGSPNIVLRVLPLDDILRFMMTGAEPKHGTTVADSGISAVGDGRFKR
ncbi:mediator of RNA polymerase II transcription subunit 8 [Acarospora aff. strigata]|nr:mediator of RNA polymerase II transcription subunit 8 [Acarospora aff. strigata]